MANGFTKIPNAILDQPWAKNQTAVYLYTWLSLNADKNGQVMTSRADLSERTGLTIQQLRTALEKLESTKFVTKQSTKLPTKFATILTVEYLTSCKDSKSKNNQVSNQASNQANNHPRAYKNDNINIMSYKTEKETTSHEVAKKEDENLSFEVFWKLYDKKVGKIKAQKLYDALSVEDRKAAIEYIPLYKQSRPDKQYRKNPETFLRNRAWEDEIINYATTQTHQRSGNPTDEQVVADMLDNIAALNKSGSGDETIPF
jgi:hypothetical protein